MVHQSVEISQEWYVAEDQQFHSWLANRAARAHRLVWPGDTWGWAIGSLSAAAPNARLKAPWSRWRWCKRQPGVQTGCCYTKIKQTIYAICTLCERIVHTYVAQPLWIRHLYRLHCCSSHPKHRQFRFFTDSHIGRWWIASDPYLIWHWSQMQVTCNRHALSSYLAIRPDW